MMGVILTSKHCANIPKRCGDHKLRCARFSAVDIETLILNYCALKMMYSEPKIANQDLDEINLHTL